MHTPEIPLTRDELHAIVNYDAATTRLVPKVPQPQLGLTATKHSPTRLQIGATLYSMSRLAYLYHHGKIISRVCHVDGNRLNYAPDNLEPYIPSGRSASLPIPVALDAHPAIELKTKLGKSYYAALRVPAKPKYTPTATVIVVTDSIGYRVTARTEQSAIRLARAHISKLSTKEKQALGMLPPNPELINPFDEDDTNTY